jgi:general secretion pathway protein G
MNRRFYGLVRSRPARSDRQACRGRRAIGGVTLLELLITMAIIFILASIAMPITKLTSKRARELELRQNLRSVRLAIDKFKKDWDRNQGLLIGPLCIKNKLSCLDEKINSEYGYPSTLEVLLRVELSGQEAAVKDVKFLRYLRRIPIDPMTNSIEWGLRCYEDESDSDNWCGNNVYDVYTKSDALAMDGTKYKDW